MRISIVVAVLLLLVGVWWGLSSREEDNGLPGDLVSRTIDSPSSTPDRASADSTASYAGRNQNDSDDSTAGIDSAHVSESLPEDVPVEEYSEDMESRYAEISHNTEYPTLAGRLDAMSERRNGQSYSPSEVMDAMEKERAWETINEVPAILPLSEEEKVDGREFIGFDNLKIETLMPGDSLAIPVSELGTTFEMIVDSIASNEGGSLTWEGHLMDHPDQTVLITQSDKLTIFGIDTPNGHFVLQAQNDVGWIASSQTLFKQDFSESDAVIPEEEQIQHD